jgi:hypothetical protein
MSTDPSATSSRWLGLVKPLICSPKALTAARPRRIALHGTPSSLFRHIGRAILPHSRWVIRKVDVELTPMTSFQSNSGNEGANTVAALGLRWAALRGMLGSPLIHADDQKLLRDELLQELQSIARGMSEIAARNGVELCAKLDVMGEELRKMARADDGPSHALLASIRKDVMSLTPRAVAERSSVQIVRGATHRSAEAAPAEAVPHSEAAKGP